MVSKNSPTNEIVEIEEGAIENNSIDILIEMEETSYDNVEGSAIDEIFEAEIGEINVKILFKNIFKELTLSSHNKSTSITSFCLDRCRNQEFSNRDTVNININTDLENEKSIKITIFTKKDENCVNEKCKQQPQNNLINVVDLKVTYVWRMGHTLTRRLGHVF
jgi:hypothetical protein